MTGKFKALSAVKKAIFAVIGIYLFIGMGAIINSPAPPEESTKELVQATSSQVKAAATVAEQPKKPVVETKTVEELVAVPFAATTQNDPTLISGKSVVAVAGVNGEKAMAYKVTYTDGLETGRVPAGERMIREPIAQVTKIGTKIAVAPKPKPAPAPAPQPASNCHPSYTGACVPSGVSDVDCSGGSGNGPYYVGFVHVVGYDEYDLDRDGNGLGCE
jgi:resuscitation-promoting factor RpfB